MFKELNFSDLNINPFTKISSEWALLAAGTKERGYNMMTASWAGFGRVWEKNAVTVYIRESRYTRKFFDENEFFTVTFLREGYRKALEICGKLHGNECDKTKESGLTPLFIDSSVTFEEAELVFYCKKLVHADIARENADAPEVFDRIYQNGDIHRIFIGEAVKILRK